MGSVCKLFTASCIFKTSLVDLEKSKHIVADT